MIDLHERLYEPTFPASVALVLETASGLPGSRELLADLDPDLVALVDTMGDDDVEEVVDQLVVYWRETRESAALYALAKAYQHFAELPAAKRAGALLLEALLTGLACGEEENVKQALSGLTAEEGPVAELAVVSVLTHPNAPEAAYGQATNLATVWSQVARERSADWQALLRG